MSITRTDVTNHLDAIKAAIVAEAQKRGLVVSFGSASYDPTVGIINLKTTLTAGVNGQPAKSKEAIDFEIAALRWGLRAADLGREFTYGGAVYRIVGAHLRKAKPIVAEAVRGDSSLTGKRYLFAPDAVRRSLDAAA